MHSKIVSSSKDYYIWMVIYVVILGNSYLILIIKFIETTHKTNTNLQI